MSIFKRPKIYLLLLLWMPFLLVPERVYAYPSVEIHKQISTIHPVSVTFIRSNESKAPTEGFAETFVSDVEQRMGPGKRVIGQSGQNPISEAEVVFSGNNASNAGFIPGETVRVEVTGPDNYSDSCFDIVDSDGAWSCTINLWETTHIVGKFSYTARGLKSAVTFSGEFTNESAIQKINLFSDSNQISNRSTVYVGTKINAQLLINSTKNDYVWGSTRYLIQKYTCDENNNCDWGTVFTSACDPQPEPNLSGILSNQVLNFYNVFENQTPEAFYLLGFSTFSDDRCSISNGGQWNYSDTFYYAKRSTETAVSCVKSDDPMSVTFICKAQITLKSGTQKAPTGKVNFHVDQENAGFFDQTSCSVVPISTDTAECSVIFTPQKTGMHNITAEFMGSDAGVPNSTRVSTSFAANNLAPVITVTADSIQKTYGESDPPLTFSYSPNTIVVRFSGALARATGEDAGTYQISQGSLVSPGYEIKFFPAQFTIEKANAIINLTGFSGIYDGHEHTATGTVTGVNGEDLSSRLIMLPSYRNAPGGMVYWTFVGNKNYQAERGGSIPVSIFARDLEITANASAKVYGDLDPELAYSITKGELLPQDQLSGALKRDAGENAGMYFINLGDLSAGPNYNLSFITAWFKIDPRTITVAADPKQIAYGSPEPQLTFSVANGTLINGDMFSGSLMRQNGTMPGVYPIFQNSLALSSNYALNFVGSNVSIYQTTSNLDSDSDGVPNTGDNCVYLINGDQKDTDDDHFGDACDSTPDTAVASVVVPVTGSSGISDFNCSGTTSLILPSGDYVTASEGLCMLDGVFSQEIPTSMPQALPDSAKYVSAVTMIVLDNLIQVQTLPQTVTLTYSFEMPTIVDGSTYTVYYWDETALNGTGTWIEIPKEDQAALNSEGSTDFRMVFSGVEQIGDKLQFATNFTGLFVLAQK